MLRELEGDPFVGAVSVAPISETCSTALVSTNGQNFNGLNGVSNPCAVYRKRDWEKMPFSERIPTIEDQHWSWRWFARGEKYRIIRLPSTELKRAGGRNPISKAVRDIYVASKLFEKKDLTGFPSIMQRLSSQLKRPELGIPQRVGMCARYLLIYLGCLKHRILKTKISSFSS
ncbi:MAG: hypothetical protein AAGA58_14220, partial [Verrucomicrobiota bacterium]